MFECTVGRDCFRLYLKCYNSFRSAVTALVLRGCLQSVDEEVPLRYPRSGEVPRLQELHLRQAPSWASPGQGEPRPELTVGVEQV